MAARPVLGIICCNRIVGADTAQAVMDRYVSAAMTYADTAALLVPSLPGLMSAAEVAPRLDGVLLTGSPSNIETQRYQDEGDEGPFDPARDEIALSLVHRMIDAGKPVFGICRGLQLINVAHGGTLYQDITTQKPGSRVHRDAEAYDLNFHEVDVLPRTRLAQLLPPGRHKINSVHHQGIKDLAPGFVAEAMSPDDGVIEAIRRTDGKWGAAVQWHPEFHRPELGVVDDTPLLRDFLQAAQEARKE